jgi:branched-chain amino acid transport system substrate-binding protein
LDANGKSKNNSFLGKVAIWCSTYYQDIPFLKGGWAMCSKRNFAMIIFALVILFSVNGLQAAEPFKIGIIYPKTGKFSMLGPKMLDGLKMALQDHGKIFGQEPKIYIRDSGTKVDLAMAAAKELIDKEHVNVMVGGMNTPINNSIANLCDEKRIPFLLPASGSNTMSGVGKDISYPQGVLKANPHPYMVTTCFNTTQRAVSSIDVAEMFGKKWYFIASDYNYGRESVGFTQQALQKKYGKDFVTLGESWRKIGEVDYSSAITKAIAADPDVVFVCVPGRFVQFQKQAVAMGLNKKAQIHWTYGERISAEAGGNAVYGVTASVEFSVEIPDWSQANNFAVKFKKNFGYWPGWPSSPAYAGMKLLLMGIEKAGVPDSGKIMRALQGIQDAKSINGTPFYIRACDQHTVQPLYTAQWTKSEKYAPGYWKIVKKFGNPEAAVLPCDVSARYDKMTY